jgi:hypothetical protein
MKMKISSLWGQENHLGSLLGRGKEMNSEVLEQIQLCKFFMLCFKVTFKFV